MQPLETQEELNQQNEIIQDEMNNNINENTNGTSISDLPEPVSNEMNIGSSIE